jgi:hypothetical protein
MVLVPMPARLKLLHVSGPEGCVFYVSCQDKHGTTFHP